MPPSARWPSSLPLLLLVAGLVAGCATGERAGMPSLGIAERRAALEALDTWEARGRIALKSPATSGQGNFVWRQTGDRAVLRVSGPFGAGAWEVREEPGRLIVLSARGEVAADYTGPDAAEKFLEEHLGWSLPIGMARHWILGLAGPDSRAVETREAGGLLAGLSQDGWQVRYDEYRSHGGIDLPRKLVLESTPRRIRLVIDAWEFCTTAARPPDSVRLRGC